MHAQHPDKTLTVVLPEMVPAHWWEQVLHNQTALRLKAALLFRPGIVVADVPYHLRRRNRTSKALTPRPDTRQRPPENGSGPPKATSHRPRVVRRAGPPSSS